MASGEERVRQGGEGDDEEEDEEEEDSEEEDEEADDEQDDEGDDDDELEVGELQGLLMEMEALCFLAFFFSVLRTFVPARSLRSAS